MELSPLHERLHAVVGGKTYRVVAEMTATNAETVRRYLSGQDPSVDFLAALCKSANINGEWLLTGRGPMRKANLTAHALQEASVSELLNAMAKTLERLAARVDRLEEYAQTLETRLRASEARIHPRAGPWRDVSADATFSSARSSPAQGISGDASIQVQPPHEKPGDQERRTADTQPGSTEAAGRAQRIVDALAKRPREDAR